LESKWFPPHGFPVLLQELPTERALKKGGKQKEKVSDDFIDANMPRSDASLKCMPRTPSESYDISSCIIAKTEDFSHLFAFLTKFSAGNGLELSQKSCVGVYFCMYRCVLDK
jgi:hypothetical protein